LYYIFRCQEFELNNGSREWERERYDLYLIQLARINYISRKNHWLWQRRVLPVNWVSKSFFTNSTRNSIYRWPLEPRTHVFVTQLFVKLRVRMFPSTLQAWPAIINPTGLPKCLSIEWWWLLSYHYEDDWDCSLWTTWISLNSYKKYIYIIERQRSEDDSMNKTGEEKSPISWGP
jgi:hypothetical protein